MSGSTRAVKTMSSEKLSLTVAILLGGESSRFGSAKAFLPWKGKSLAAHMAQTAGSIAHEVFFVGKNYDQIPPDARSLNPFLADLPNLPGPLGGLAAVLKESSHPWIFTTGVDMPYLNGEVLKGLWELGEKAGSTDAIVPYVEDLWQPLCALWNRSVLVKLSDGTWKSFQFFLNNGGIHVTRVEEAFLIARDPDLRCLRGFNSKEEWDQLPR